MAAIELPWQSHMSTQRRPRGDTFSSESSSTHPGGTTNPDASSSYLYPSEKPVYASFSPATLASASSHPISAAKRLSTILVHQKSPLLLATPPQVTRALAYSHPFLLPLNKLAALLTWTTGDAWESFLLLGLYWAIVLYGDAVLRFASPLVLVVLLIAGMYGRRFSPLSSSGWREDGGAGGSHASISSAGKKGKTKATAEPNKPTGGEPLPSSPAKTGGAPSGGSGLAGSSSTGGDRTHHRAGSEATNTKHQKTLDEIVETLKQFTARCNILLEPLLELTDFLSTQRSATSATTRPALTRLLIRILLCTPFWVILTLPPLRVVTTRRVMLCFGTVVLTWHANYVKAGRTILWRSASVRGLVGLITGLEIAVPTIKAAPVKKTAAQEALEKLGGGGKAATTTTPTSTRSRESELTKAIRRAHGATDAGVRFTFIIYENQRRWVGLGWTNSLFAYERDAWTDEHNNTVPPRDKFELPEVEEDSNMRWRWVEGSRWRVDGVPDEAVMGGDGEDGEKWVYDGEGGKNGWVYYDNKWQNGRRGQDGWGRWTRRRKWYRDAELVEVDSDDEQESDDQVPTTNSAAAPTAKGALKAPINTSATPMTASERAPSLPPHLTMPTLAPPFTTTTESIPKADATTLHEIKEEEDENVNNEKGDDVASVLSTSSRSTGRFRMPSLRRRVGDRDKQPPQSPQTERERDRDILMSSPRSVAGSVASRGRLSRRASDVLDEDEVVAFGVARTVSDSWGVGDEVAMGLD